MWLIHIYTQLCGCVAAAPQWGSAIDTYHDEHPEINHSVSRAGSDTIQEIHTGTQWQV